MKLKTVDPFLKNPFTALSELKLVAIPDMPQTHEPRQTLRSYLTTPESPLRSLAEALTGGKKPKTVTVEKTREAEPKEEETAAPEPVAKPMKWGR